MGWAPAAAGPRGRARWRKESASTMIAVGWPVGRTDFLGVCWWWCGKCRGWVVRLIRLD